MSENMKHIKEKMMIFYQNTITMPDIEERMDDYLFGEIYNDFQEKGIKSFGDWLKYYSTDGNNFQDIVDVTEAYYFKALTEKFDNITIEEKIIAHNALALYSLEMDIDKPRGRLIGTIISTFIEIVRHYNLYIKGYLLMRGNVFISDRTKTKFFSVWSNGSTFNKEMPITLFTPND